MKRRKFIHHSALGMVGLSMATPQNWFLGKKRELGIILNTVKKEMEENPEKTLEQLAELGYNYVEGGVYGKSAASYGKILKSLGLKSIAGGAAMGNFEKDLGKYLDQANALNYAYIVCYWPWMSSATNLTLEECKKTAERLNRIGEKVKKEGFRLAWHNHDKEFADIGQMDKPFDILMKNTDPELVTVEMDLYWVKKGNADPVDLIKRYPGRFELFHVKDMDLTSERKMTCVGEGKINFKEIFKWSKKAGLKYPIVENEQSTNGIQCATISYKSAFTAL